MHRILPPVGVVLLAIGAGWADAVVASLRADPALGKPVDTLQAGPNDNRRAAGQLRGNLLDLRMIARPSRWRPEMQRGPEALVYAFAEEGGAPEIPGPLIRVPVGTDIRIAIRNALPQVLRVYGLQDRPATALDSVMISPGETRQLRMRAGAPGTYLYWGRTTVDTFTIGQLVDGQLSGAIVVDTTATSGREPTDRIWVMGLWQAREKPPGTPVQQREETLVFNGLAWPHTERLAHSVGDTRPLAGHQCDPPGPSDAPPRFLLSG
ncbi:MAG: multicopper oxidase domain-containing protein [Gemmatimonadales bacterium]